MKIAVPANGKFISSHFGHCASFKIFDIENKAIIGQISVDAPGEHKPGELPKLLKDHGVNVIIAGGLGQKAIEIFNGWGIKMVVGASGLIEKAINDFLNGTLDGGDNACSH